MNRKSTALQFCPSAIPAWAGLALCLFSFSLPVSRAADDTNAPPKPHWESVASADLTLTRGNSRSFLGTFGINSTKKWPENEILLGASAGYGETTTQPGNTTTKTADFLRGFAQYNHLFTERLYAGLRVEGLHDDIADINYRFTISPMVGYYFIKQTNTFLSGEAGPSYVNQQVGEDTESYLAGRVAERFEYNFKTKAKIWESVEWVTQFDKVENWFLNAEIGVSAPISKAVDARLIFQDTYNNEPAAGRQKNDLKLLAGIGYKF